MDILVINNKPINRQKSIIKINSAFGKLSVLTKEALIQLKKLRNNKIDKEDIEKLNGT